jgi:hypothetical protein
VSGLSDRVGGLSGRLATGERRRDLQEVTLLLVDGTRIHGVLHRAPGTRTLDYLNRQAEAFLAMTNAILSSPNGDEHHGFIAINKLHIARVIEIDDEH